MFNFLRRNRNKLLIGLLIFLLFLVFVMICIALYAWNKLDKITYADETENTFAVSEPSSAAESHVGERRIVDIDVTEARKSLPFIPEWDVSEDDGVLNILLIGTDERSEEYHVNARADSMVLVSIDKEKNTVRLVSLERAIGVPILEGDLKGQYDLLTHIFRWGGADLLIQTVEHCFKIEVNHYIRLNFDAVKKIVDAIGGIDVELDKSEAEYLGPHIGQLTSTGKQMDLKAGMNHLDGGTALAYARLRAIDSDWQRVGRQRKVILAVSDALKGSSLRELNDLADTVLPLVQTNLTKMEIAKLVFYAPNFLSAEFDQLTIPKQGTYGTMKIRGGGTAFAVDFEVNNDILHRFLYEGVSSEELLAE